jgi:predicted RND superfamily exporter protein
MQKQSQRGFSMKWLLIFIAIFLIIFLSVAVFAISHRSVQAPAVPDYTQPSAKTTDLAPGSPNADKTAIMVRHSDSSYEKFLVPNATVDSYIKSLPSGDTVISQTSPAN